MKSKGRCQEAIIGIVLAAVMLAFVLAAMIGSTGAYSEGGPYNIIEKDMGLKEQKVLIGQDLDFRQGWGSNIVTIYRMKEGSIEWTKKADPDNTLKVGNDWIKDESYYVNFGFDPRKQWDACFSVTDVDMPLKLKVDDKMVSFIYVETDLTIDINGMNLFNNDKVDLVVIGPDGQIKYDEVNKQKFTDITVKQLYDQYGDDALETEGWTNGTYTFQIKTIPEYACGLEAESAVKELKILKRIIRIGAEKNMPYERETVKLTVTGIAGDGIKVEADPLSEYVIFKKGIDDTPTGADFHENWFTDVIDEDGIRKYAVEFNDTGTYMIKVTVTGPAESTRVGDSDTVDITALEKPVYFDLPSTVVIGDKINIQGDADSGTHVSVYIDNYLYDELVNLAIEDHKFSKEVKTTDVGMNVPGLVRLKAWVDCDKKAGDACPIRCSDGEDVILVEPAFKVTPKISDANIGSSHNLNVKFINTQDFDDNIFVALTTDGISKPHKADLSWFNWDAKTISMKAKAEVDIPLLCSIPDNETICSNKSFRVIATTSYTGQSVYDDIAFINITKPPQKCCREWEDECPEIVYSDPVEIITGNLILSHQDLYIPNERGPAISIERTYNSRSSENGLFGYSWNFNYDYRFTTNTNGDVVLRQCEGKVFIFENTTSGYVAPPGLHEDLTKLQNGPYIKTLKDGTKQYFDVNGKLTKIEDRNGNALDFTYNSRKLVKIEDNSGHTVTIAYENNRIKKISAPGNRVIEYSYSGNKLVSVYDSMDNVVQYEYNDYNNLIARTTPNSGRYEYSYTADDKLYSQKDPEGNEKLFNYDNEQRIVTITDENGNDETRQYDSNYDVILIANALGQIEAYEWNLNHYLLNKIDVYGYKTQYIRDAKDNIDKVINPCGYDMTYEYEDKYNLVTKETKMVGGTEVSSTTYSYDANGNLVDVQDAEGGVTSYTYNTYGQQTSMTDANGHTTSYTYSPDIGYLKNEIDAQGNDMSYTYDEMGNRISETTTSADGTQSVTTLYEYDKNNQLIRIIDALNRDTTYSYDANGNKNKETDIYGGITKYEYCKNDLLKAIKEPLGKTTTYTYYGEGLTKDITVENGANDQVTNYYYDALYRTTAVIDAEGYSTEYTYSLTENKVTVTNSRGYDTTTTYDAIGRVIEEKDALGYTTSYTYEDLSNTRTITDKREYSTIYKYDQLDRLIEVVDATGNKTTYTYDKFGNLINTTDARSHTTQNVYDSLNRLVVTVDLSGKQTKYGYDYLGRQINTTDALGNIYRTEYDAVGRVIKEIDSLGHETVYNYNDAEHSLSITDAEYNCVKDYYDDLDRLIREDRYLDSQEIATSYEHDLVGNLIEVTDAKGHSTLFTYDKLNRQVSSTDAVGNITYFKYDENGNLIKRTDANGDITLYEYDRLDRLVLVGYPDGSKISYGYDANSNPISIKDKNVNALYAYDELNRLVEEKWASHGWYVAYSYDAVGNRIKMQDQLGDVTTYDYDSNNRLVRIIDPNGGITKFSYDNVGRRIKLSYPNGVETSYTYDNANRLLNLLNKKSSTIISNYTYSYDNVSNRVNMTESNGAVTAITEYIYDGLYRLNKANKTGYENWKRRYIYNAVGNRIKLTVDGSETNYSYDDDNRLVSSTNVSGTTYYGYDPNGNQIYETFNGSTTSYTYDFENRLIRIVFPDTTTNEYNYNALGKRISKKAVENNVTKYFYDGDNILIEFDGSGAVSAKYTTTLRIDEIILKNTSTDEQYFHYDGLGSVTGLSNSTGDEVGDYTYSPFGLLLSETGIADTNDYTFTGREYDRDALLYYYRARHYDPYSGRFIQRDPLGYITGLNLYEYVRGNVINRRDPFGLYIDPETWDVWSICAPSKDGGTNDMKALESGEVKYFSGWIDYAYIYKIPKSRWKRIVDRWTACGVGLKAGSVYSEATTTSKSLEISKKVGSELGLNKGGASFTLTAELAVKIGIQLDRTISLKLPGGDIPGRKNCKVHYWAWRKYKFWRVFDAESANRGIYPLGSVKEPTMNFKEFIKYLPC